MTVHTFGYIFLALIILGSIYVFCMSTMEPPLESFELAAEDETVAQKPGRQSVYTGQGRRLGPHDAGLNQVTGR